jgi:hypothetical protein
VRASVVDDARKVIFEFYSIEVSELALPSDREGRYRVSVASPLVVRGWISAKRFPLELVRRVEWKPPNLWLDAGARVNAWTTGPGRAVVWRPLQPSLQSEAMEFSLSCSDLRLANTAVSRRRGEYGFDGRQFALTATPRGQPIAYLSLPNLFASVDVLETRDDWSHVRGSLSHTTIDGVEGFVPFDFDAWTSRHVEHYGPDLESWSAFLGKETVTNRTQPAPTHRTVRTLRASYEPDQPPNLTIAAGVRLRADRKGTRVWVTLDGVEPSLFVDARDFDVGTDVLSGN